MMSENPAIASSQPAPAPAGSQETTGIQKLNKIIKASRTCMLTTKGEYGMHSRPMATAGIDFSKDEGEAIYFVTDKTTTKIKEIMANPEVGLVFCNDAHQQWATVTATATVVEDLPKTKELWHTAYNAWFPSGPETPGVVLIKAVPTIASYWDGTPLNRLHIMFSALRSKVTGKPIDQRKTQESQSVVFPQPQSPARAHGEGQTATEKMMESEVPAVAMT